MAHTAGTPPELALVGCGRMGRAHLAAASATRAARIVAVVDPAHDGDAIAGRPLRSLDEVLDSGVDGLLVASSTPSHQAIVERALSAGLHVLCEKPLTLDPAADLALGRLARERRRVLQVGFWRRFSEPYRALRSILARGEIGAPCGMRAAQWDAEPPSARFCDVAVSGGIEVDCGVHELDLARWLLGQEVAHVAVCGPAPSAALAAVGDTETVYALARLSGGAALAVDLTRVAGHRDSIRTEVIGESGSAVVEFADTGTIEVRAGTGSATSALAAPDVIAAALAAQIEAFAAAIRTGRPDADAALAADSERALAAALAMRAARLDGAWRDVGTAAQLRSAAPARPSGGSG
jgi:predicted dehydrogenase